MTWPMLEIRDELVAYLGVLPPRQSCACASRFSPLSKGAFSFCQLKPPLHHISIPWPCCPETHCTYHYSKVAVPLFALKMCVGTLCFVAIPLVVIPVTRDVGLIGQTSPGVDHLLPVQRINLDHSDAPWASVDVSSKVGGLQKWVHERMEQSLSHIILQKSV
jgi:hypothetical protein